MASGPNAATVMSPQRKNTSEKGGTRRGAGRPKATLTEQQVRAMVRAAKKYEKEFGKSIDEVILDLAYDRDGTTPATVRLGAARLYKDHTQAKVTEGSHSDKNVAAGPQIYLPEMDNVTPIVETEE